MCCPSGALACPYRLCPQHATVPPTLSAQAWCSPLIRVVNRPSGPAARPVAVVAPADDEAVGPEPARVDLAGGDGGVLPVGCVGLSVLVVFPSR